MDWFAYYELAQEWAKEEGDAHKRSAVSRGLALRRRKGARRRAQKGSAGGSHTLADIEQMHEDQGGLCAYCEVELNERYHVDHMLPLSRGGSDDVLNLAITCPPCNMHKKAKTVEEFFAT